MAGQSINARQRHPPGATADGGVRPRPRPRLGRCSARDPRSRGPAVVAGTGKNMQQGSQASVTGWDSDEPPTSLCAWLMTRSACATLPRRLGSPSVPPTGSCPSWSRRDTCCARHGRRNRYQVGRASDASSPGPGARGGRSARSAAQAGAASEADWAHGREPGQWRCTSRPWGSSGGYGWDAVEPNERDTV